MGATMQSGDIINHSLVVFLQSFELERSKETREPSLSLLNAEKARYAI
jgi:hypothetical protein